jgi:hypothetical protein
MQRVEVGIAVNATYDGLAVKPLLPVLQRGFDYARIPPGPVITTLCNEPDPIPVSL